MKSSQTRRQFIGRTSLATAGIGLGLSINAKTYAQSKGANNKVVMGVIGCGGMSRHNVGKLLQVPGVEFAAVCDVDSANMAGGAEQLTKAGRTAPKHYKDFRQLLERKDIDAVVINTPDHWHALPFIAACEAGKDIYCEKPISQNFVEAKAMMNAANHFKRVVQVGTWQRSMNHFNEAIKFVRSGKMGDINICRAWAVNEASSKNSDIGKKSPEAAPLSLDYDFWLGPAAKRPYQANRAHYSWRWFFDYGGGLMTDWGVHMIDIVLLGMNQFDPLTVSSTGGIFTTNDDRDTPDTMQASYRFPKWLLQWENRFNNKRGLDGGKNHGAEFIGSKGTLIVDREGYQYFPETEGNEAPPPSNKQESTHWQNFVDCMKSREKPASNIDSMGRTTMLCHLGNIALQSGKTLRWDAKDQDVANRGDVKDCISYEREYRKPWKLKMYKA